MKTRNLSDLRILDREDLNLIHDASIKTLQEKGIVLKSKTALEIVKRAGAKVDGETVYFSRKMVEDALALCPRTIKWRGRKESNSIVIGEGVHVQAGGGCVNIQDMDNGRRPGTLADFINIQKLYQSSKVVDIVGFTPVDTSDLETTTKHMQMQYQILKHTDKPIHGHVCGGKGAAQMLEMVEIAFGEEGLLKNHHVMGLSINTISPLVIGEDQLDTLIEYVTRNQIVIAAPMAIGGVSAPISHIGMTVLVNAETLALITLTQAINPGNPVICAPSSSFGDMKTAAYAGSIPDGLLHLVTNIQLVRELYQLPARVLCGPTSSKAVDVQAGYETMQGLLMTVLAGADIVAHGIGILDALMTISMEKIIIDEELVQRAMYLKSRPLDLSEEALAVGIIKDVEHGGSFLPHPSVFKECRNLFSPSISDWSNFAEWNSRDSQDILVRANSMYKARLAKSPESLLDPLVEKELQAYMEKANLG